MKLCHGTEGEVLYCIGGGGGGVVVVINMVIYDTSIFTLGYWCLLSTTSLTLLTFGNIEFNMCSTS